MLWCSSVCLFVCGLICDVFAGCVFFLVCLCCAACCVCFVSFVGCVVCCVVVLLVYGCLLLF